MTKSLREEEKPKAKKVKTKEIVEPSGLYWKGLPIEDEKCEKPPIFPEIASEEKDGVITLITNVRREDETGTCRLIEFKGSLGSPLVPAAKSPVCELSTSAEKLVQPKF